MINSSEKKPIKNTTKSTKYCKKNNKKEETKIKSTKTTMQNTLTKLNNLSNIVGNNSILTQRNNSFCKSKLKQINRECQKTKRAQSSQKMIVSTKIQTKNARQCQYQQQKAKQLNKFINKKISMKKESKQKKNKSAYNSVQKKQVIAKVFEDPFKKVEISSNLNKLANFLNEGTQKITEIKKNSDSFILEQMQKAQKVLLDKIKAIQQNNNNFSQQNNAKFNQIKQKNERQVEKCRNEIKYLVLKIEQQNNMNVTLQKKISFYERDFSQFRSKIQLKDSLIKNLQNQNHQLSEDNNRLNTMLRQSNYKITNLENDFSVLKKLNVQLEQKLRKSQVEKQYIKENSTRVLQLLREQFGDDLKQFTLR